MLQVALHPLSAVWALQALRNSDGALILAIINIAEEGCMFHFGFIGLLVLVLDIVALVSLLTGHASVGHKVLWTLLILLLPLAGMALYFLIGRSPADA